MMTAPLLAWALLLSQQAPPPVRLKPGDVVALYVATADSPPPSATAPPSPFNREITVLSDGSIYGIGFGKLKVSGLTPPEAQTNLRRALKKLFREEDVFLTILKQKAELAYIVGTNSPGPVELPSTPITLRQLLPPTLSTVDAQRLDVQLVRAGQVVGRSSYSRALAAEDPLGSTVILPNDLVSVIPQETVRVWVVGPVKSPGQVLLPVGSTIYQAIASAGGYAMVSTPGGPQSLESESRITLRHGPETIEFPATPNPSGQAPKVSEGDVITVSVPELIRVVVAGKVNKPDQFTVSTGLTLLQAVNRASGPLPEASLSRVFLFRHGEVMQYDFTGLTQGVKVDDPKLMADDLVYVDENRRDFYVFGHVVNNGRFLMTDGKTYRATDALAIAGGLGPKGSMRRVFLYHPNPNGKPTITEFNLDEFLKDGKLSSNPEIQPGDALLFSEPEGLTINSVTQAFTSFFYLRTLVNP